LLIKLPEIAFLSFVRIMIQPSTTNARSLSTIDMLKVPRRETIPGLSGFFSFPSLLAYNTSNIVKERKNAEITKKSKL